MSPASSHPPFVGQAANACFLEARWSLLDYLSGLLMQDDARRDGPHLHDLQDEIWFKTTSRQDCDAAEHAQRLKAELDANQQAATQRHSRAILVALRTGSPPPVAETPVAADTAALTAALAHQALQFRQG